jgi:hypothetical protein
MEQGMFRYWNPTKGRIFWTPNEKFSKIRGRTKHATNTFEYQGRLFPSIFLGKIKLG